MKQCKFILLVALAIAGCSEKKEEKITDIPVTTQSKEAAASFQQGLQLSDEGDVQKARLAFAKAIEQDSTLGIAYLYKANTATSNKEFMDDFAKGKAHLNSASDWEKMYAELENTYLTGDYDKRIDVAKKIADKYPDAARAQVELGNTYLGSNDFTRSRQCYTKAVELNPKWIGGYSSLVASYLFNEPKDFKKAEENALKAAELAPSNAGVQITLGDCYRAENDLEKAKAAYSKAIELSPDNSAGYYKRGHANVFMGKYDEARKDYSEAGKYDDIKTNKDFNIANTYIYEGNVGAATKYLSDAMAKADMSTEPDDKKVGQKLGFLNSSAMIALHTGDGAKLKELTTMMQPLSDMISKEIGTQEAKLQGEAQVLYWQSIAAAAAGNYDEAKTKAEQIKTTLNPVKDPLKLQQYNFALGYLAMKQKNYGDAVSHFEKADPNAIYNTYWLAVANEAAGNKDKAGTLYKEVANYNFNDIGYALVRSDVKKKASMP